MFLQAPFLLHPKFDDLVHTIFVNFFQATTPKQRATSQKDPGEGCVCVGGDSSLDPELTWALFFVFYAGWGLLFYKLTRNQFLVRNTFTRRAIPRGIGRGKEASNFV